MNHPVYVTVCGCPDPNCGGWHTIVMDRTLPTKQDCAEAIKNDNKKRKS